MANDLTFNIIRANCGWKGRDLFIVLIPNSANYIIDPYYPFIRFIGYEPLDDEAWGEEQFDLFITAINFIYRKNDDRMRICLLSSEGEFIIRENGQRNIEKIFGAGIDGDERGNGRLYGMTIINNHVYAYGESRQIYRRSDEGDGPCLIRSCFNP